MRVRLQRRFAKMQSGFGLWLWRGVGNVGFIFSEHRRLRSDLMVYKIIKIIRDIERVGKWILFS